MKTFLRRRKGKQTEIDKLKVNLANVYVRCSSNKMQDYIAEDMAERLYELGWRRN